MSQTVLGHCVGVSYQQIHKYERGQDRMSASLVFYIARALDVSPGEIFGGAPGGNESPFHAEDAFVDAFDRLPSQELKHKIALLVESLANQAAE